jgi:MoaA/NifB/PqqE/SkfB family radical SAM enzyme
MDVQQTLWAEVDADGRLILPPEVARQYGLSPGARAKLDVGDNDIRLHRAVTHLAKIYLEPTNRCNLDCRTCMRNNWNVELGQMSAATFEAVLDNLHRLPEPPLVFFGGIGEPLAHPSTPEMVAQVKATGATAELITNGTLLDEKRSHRLIEAGLDALWVSIDGARPESYADVRLGAELPNVLANLARFDQLRPPAHRRHPAIGIAFVAMKRNIADLPEVMAIGRRVRAARFMVSNLLPHTSEMVDEILYQETLNNITYLPSPWMRWVSIPKMDFDELTGQPLLEAMSSGYNVKFAGNNMGSANDVCTFVESGALAIGWDGRIAPCPPLLHEHTGYLRGYERLSVPHVLGNIRDADLLSLWHDPEYVVYRERVHSFAFAPCTSCGGCDDSHANETDCFESLAPACGGCLWAQAVIQCP